MATYALQPDVDLAVITFLRSHPLLAPLHGGRVGHRLTSPLPSLRVTSIGGSQEWPWEAVSEFAIECWGGDYSTAHTLARTVVAVTYDLVGPVAGGHIRAAVVTLRPTSQDDESGRPRVLVHIEVTTYPEA